jgi:PAS domain S-box-containing protein
VIGIGTTTGELERLVDLSLDLLCITTMSGEILAVNPAWSVTLGWPESELHGRKGIDFVHPDDRERTRAQAAELAKPGHEVHAFENRMLHRDGSFRWLSWGLRADGDRIYAVAHDVTERNRVEAAAREATQLFSIAFNDAPIGMSVWTLEPDAEFRLLQVNRAFCKLVGRTPQGLLGTRPLELVHPDDRAAGRAQGDAIVRGEIDSASLDQRLVRPDGTVVSTRLRLSVARDDAGTARFGIAQVQDLTAARNREHALRATEARYQTLVETTSDGVWTIDADHRTTFVNERMAALLGYTVDEMLGRPVTDFERGEATEPAPDGRRRVTLTRKDGTAVEALVAGSPLTDDAGGYGGALALVSATS